MFPLLHRRGATAVVIALVAAACSSAASDPIETTTTTAAATTTVESTTTTTTVESTTTTTTAAGESSGTDAIVDAARPYVSPGGRQYDYAPTRDDSGTLSVSLPTVWDDVDGRAWFDDDRRSGPSIVAAASIDTFYTDFSAPGIFVGTSDILVEDLGPDDVADEWDFSASCTLASTDPITTDTLDGRLAVWTDCGDTGAALLTFAALPPDGAYLAIVTSIVLTETDVEAFATAVDTLATDVGSIEALSPSEVTELVSAYIGTSTQDTETGIVEIQDDAGTLTLMVPSTWTDVEGAVWEIDGADVGTRVTAAPDIERYAAEWGVPGVFYAISEELAAPEDLGVQLDRYQFDDSCTNRGRYPFEGLLYTGSFDLWTECGEPASALIVMEAYRPNKPFLAYLEIVIATPEDLTAVETILDSFDVLRQN